MTPEARAPRAGWLAGRPWTAVVLLMLLALFNYIDRFLPAILAEPMKRELGLSDTFLGAMNGLAFTLVYAVAGIPIARFADRGRYGLVISGALGFWSLMTALTGVAQNAWQLAATRMGVAVGEAGSTPASHAYISRNFRPEQRHAALSVMSIAAPAGSMAALIVGGMIAQAMGWRAAFLLLGVLGLVVTPLIYMALGGGEPVKQPTGRQELGGVLRYLRKPAVIAVCAASGFMAMGGYATGLFAAAFMIRVHGMSVGAVGAQLGVMVGAAGIATMLLMGWLGGKLAGKDPRWPLWILCVGIVLTLPFSFIGYLFAEGSAAIPFLAIAAIMGTAYLGLTVGALHNLVPAAMRAQASALLLFGNSVLGGLGPLFVGILSDALTPHYGVRGLGVAMMVMPASFVLGGVCYLVAALTFKRDMVREEET